MGGHDFAAWLATQLDIGKEAFVAADEAALKEGGGEAHLVG
ncbi:hypothetical protein J2851_002217 [Azospirillum rugosum]|uniref:Uncharacterized protein n=1 Tax=Azospirillum rugosum TaxID=416170 RepID=A0ABS4SKG8_9PROT|nr:hypothetical protein [Azospirillum rugosum]MDQ0526206.1 hypothetical protein [Azospirillum rugosum]